MDDKQPKKDYWFVTKRYGWGWVPATKEGWLVLLAYLFVVFVITLRSSAFSSDDATYALYVVPRALIATLILILICYKTGEPPRWRWGGK